MDPITCHVKYFQQVVKVPTIYQRQTEVSPERLWIEVSSFHRDQTNKSWSRRLLIDEMDYCKDTE